MIRQVLDKGKSVLAVPPVNQSDEAFNKTLQNSRENGKQE